MDPREKLYNDIKAAIEERVGEIQHIDLWNENVAFVDEDSEWLRPAVFVEFGTISWELMKHTDYGKYMRGSGIIKLHLVTDWNDEAYHASFELGESIWEALSAIESRSDYQVSYPFATDTNHSHMELLENIDAFKVKYLKVW